MSVAASRPSGKRLDDVRSLRFRFRTLTFSGSYPTGGEVITAQSVGLKQIYAVVPLDTIVKAPGTTTGSQVSFAVASDFRSVNVLLLNDAAGAAQATVGVEKSAGAHVANSFLNVLILGS